MASTVEVQTRREGNIGIWRMSLRLGFQNANKNRDWRIGNAIRKL
jgi:hypothetical protein